MESITEMLSNLTILDPLDVNSKHWVEVTHVNNPHSFYVRLIKYNDYMVAIQEPGETLLPSELQIRKTVIYKSVLLDRYIRGQVIFIQNDSDKIFCDLFALDYGCFEKSVPLSKMRKVLNASRVPPLAVHCKLADCKPKEENWSETVTECMKHFISKTDQLAMKIRAKSPEALTVEITNSYDDISTLLAYMGYTCLGYAGNVVSRFGTATEPKKLYYNFQEFNIYDYMLVRFQSGSTLESFYVATIKDHKTYLEERQSFNESCKSAKVMRTEDVKVGMPVAVEVEFKTKYERALVNEITVPNSKAHVQLVDWGRQMEVSFEKLKPISEFFLSRPAVAIYCRAQEHQIWNPRFQKIKYPGYQFKINIVQLGNKFDTPNIVELGPVT